VSAGASVLSAGAAIYQAHQSGNEKSTPKDNEET
jgi:hypothetical protein